jgi:hypothetical protein
MLGVKLMITEEQLAMLGNPSYVLAVPILRTLDGISLSMPFMTRCGSIEKVVNTVSSAMEIHTDTQYKVRASLYNHDMKDIVSIPIEDILSCGVIVRTDTRGAYVDAKV